MQQNIFEGLEEVTKITGLSIKPYALEILGVDQVPASEPLQLEKKKPELNQSDADAWLNKLRDAGETIDLEQWELVHEDEAGDHATESDLNEKYKALELSLESYANGEQRSKYGDAGLYKLRYAYSQNLSDNSRPFCVEMVGLSQSGKVYRYEDIQEMGDAGENGDFAPEGQSTYDIFTWKGGAFCHHFWKRQVYFRKRDKNARFLPNDGLNNDKRVANDVPFVPQKGKEGVAPINTPTRGSIKYG
jgi:hypothetical protein